jgi:phosphoglycolate phosphatase
MVEIRCGNVTFKDIEAIIFDKDGTLEDSRNFLRELAQKRSRLVDAQIPGIGEPLLMAFGLLDADLDPKGLMAVGSRRENIIAAAAYIAETGRSWSESLEIAENAFIEADRYLQRTPETAPLFPGTRELLQQLKAAGLKLGILSADSTAGVETFVERFELGNDFDLATGIDPEDPFKPDPALFLKACRRIGVKPQAALMVGDSALDIEMGIAAEAAGTVAVSWQQAGGLDKADVTISCWDEIQVVPTAQS